MPFRWKGRFVMSDHPSSATPQLPDSPSLEWLRKRAKSRLAELREADPAAQLSDAQFELAKQYGFSSWRALKAHVDSLTVDGQLAEAARAGHVEALAILLDEHPHKLNLRTSPYEQSLLHLAATNGHLGAVDLLLRRGLEVNTRDGGDNAYAMHFAAGAGHLPVVRRLADAGGDVIGTGDDHGLEVIGWATCFEPCHVEVAEFLLSRGARHHIFSAIALNRADEVRRIVAADPTALSSRLTRNDDHRMPLHHAVLKNLPEMVELLLELGADPLAVDGSGQLAATYATAPDTDRQIMATIRSMTAAELSSARRGHRPARHGPIDLIATLALRDWDAAEQLLAGGQSSSLQGVLHLAAKRNDVAAVRWLLDHNLDPNALWAHWDADVTPLHLAASQGHAEVVRLLLEAGADPEIIDSKHSASPIGWADFFEQPHIVRILRGEPEDERV